MPVLQLLQLLREANKENRLTVIRLSWSNDVNRSESAFTYKTELHRSSFRLSLWRSRPVAGPGSHVDLHCPIITTLWFATYQCYIWHSKNKSGSWAGVTSAAWHVGLMLARRTQWTNCQQMVFTCGHSQIVHQVYLQFDSELTTRMTDKRLKFYRSYRNCEWWKTERQASIALASCSSSIMNKMSHEG